MLCNAQLYEFSYLTVVGYFYSCSRSSIHFVPQFLVELDRVRRVLTCLPPEFNEFATILL